MIEWATDFESFSSDSFVLQLIISLMFCLAEWSMKIPPDELTKSKPSSLYSVLSALDSIIKGVKSESSMDSTGALLDRIFSSQKLAKGKSSPDTSIEAQRSLHPPLTTSFSDPQHQEVKHANEQKATSAIKLAAKAVNPSGSPTSDMTDSSIERLIHSGTLPDPLPLDEQYWSFPDEFGRPDQPLESDHRE